MASRSVWLPSKSNEARNFSKFPGQHAMTGPAAWPARAGSTVLHSGHQSEGSRTPPMQRRWERCIRPRGRPARRRPIHRRRQAGGDVPSDRSGAARYIPLASGSIGRCSHLTHRRRLRTPYDVQSILVFHGRLRLSRKPSASSDLRLMSCRAAPMHRRPS
jgi:hypothetical protein